MNTVGRASSLVAAFSLLGCLVPGRPASAESHLPALRLPFIANEGQVAHPVAYYAPTSTGTLFVTRRGELVYGLRGAGGAVGHDRSGDRAVTETLVGGSARPVGRDRAATEVAYFLGRDSARWRSDVRTYQEVELGEVWPGVTVALRAREGGIEKIFTVHPGAPITLIRIRVGGASPLELDGEGALRARAGSGTVTFTAPIAYQDHAGVRQAVTVAYRPRGREYGFAVGAYDPTRPLIIDPILQSTYLGAGALDGATALAIAPGTGDVYVAGNTQSTNFPGTAGGAQPTPAGRQDAFVARLSSDLTALLGVTYLGGGADDTATALAVAPGSGDVYVAGGTTSSNFPATAGGAQPTFGGGASDAYVVRLSADLRSLIRATYLGGNAFDAASALAIAPATGHVYVAGSSQSTNFPGTNGGAQATYGGGAYDAFVALLPSSLAALTQATYLGGNDVDGADALAIAPGTGDVYVAGGTASANFPGTSGGAQPTYGSGSGDAFVARLPSGLTTLVQATYLGGIAWDSARAVAIAPGTGDVYLAGETASTNFPGALTLGGAQPTFGGGFDAFVARLSGSLTTLIRASYLGGSGVDEATGLAIAPGTGDVYVAGRTVSVDFPGTSGGAQPTWGGAFETAFVARLRGDLGALAQATYLGGTHFDDARALAIGSTTGDVYVAGYTNSADFPAVSGGAQSAFGGGDAGDAYVARLTSSLALVDQPFVQARISVNQSTFAVGQRLSAGMRLDNPGAPGAADLYLGALLPDGMTIVLWTGGDTFAVSHLDDVRTLRPYAAGVSLSTPFSSDTPSVVSHQWAAGDPRGHYVVFHLVTKAGTFEILSLATTSFAFP